MLGLLLGICFAPLYEGLRIIRLLLPYRAVIFICDVVFFIAAAEGVFRLSLVLGNHIRGYTIAGFGFGMFAYIVTLGRILNKAESAAAHLWRRTLHHAVQFICSRIKSVFIAIAQFAKRYFGKIADFIGKRKKSVKEHLIFKGKIGYNNKTDIKDNGGSVTTNVIQAQVRRGS